MCIRRYLETRNESSLYTLAWVSFLAIGFNAWIYWRDRNKRSST
jgi:hypothetical protein